jgi:hypothetical protein
MSRSVTMDVYGNFTVSDDPDSAISVALWIAAAHLATVDTALAPDGNGLHVEGMGSIDRVTAREELPIPWDEDPAYDPEARELWRITREAYSVMPDVGRAVLVGSELRELVARALELRARSADARV